MPFGLDQYIPHPVSVVGLVVIAFGVLAAFVKFLNDAFGVMKNFREGNGKREEPLAGDSPRTERKAFVPGQRSDAAKTILAVGAGSALGIAVDELLSHHRAGDALLAEGIHDTLPADVDMDGDADVHDPGGWDVDYDGFDIPDF
jgi:hypothetical protein